jgi:hypothetical protein
MKSLAELARQHGTDKEGPHSYATPYEQHFAPLRNQKLTVLEIGIGGYEDPNAGGAGLRMWKEYFPLAQIVALDFYDKTPLKEDRIDIFQGSQDDPRVLQGIVDKYSAFDIVIDDGSHFTPHVIASFGFLFPHLRQGGIYVVEDTQTSYWPALGGSSDDLNRATTATGFLKQLTDGLNHREIIRPGYKPTYYDLNIFTIQFYHNIIFVYKGDNSEESNHLVNNTVPQHLRVPLLGPDAAV